MQLGITGRMAIAGALVAATVAITFGLLVVAVDNLRRSSSATQESQELLAAANRLQILIVQLQSSQRGYLIANDRNFLQTYDRAAVQLEEATSEVERLALGDPDRLPVVRRITRDIRSYYDAWSSPLLRLATRDIDAARARVASGEGERRGRAIDALFDTLGDDERAQVVESTTTADRDGRNAIRFGVAAAATILLLLVVIVGYFTVGVVTPVKRLASASRRATSGDLAARVDVSGVGEAVDLTRDFNEMMRVREQESRDLQRQSSELAAVLDAAVEGIGMTDTAGELVFTNERMDTFWQELGVAEKGSIWNRLARLAELTGVAESYAPAFAEIAADPEAVFEDDFGVPSLQRSFHGYTAPVRGHSGVVIGRLFSLRDTTRERAAEQAKEEFLATVSHELRTPLTSIRGFLELVREGEVGGLTTEQDRFLGIVDRSAQHLHGLVDDLLVVGRTDEGRLDLKREEIDLAEIVVESVEALANAAEEKRIALTCAAEPGLILQGDRRRLAQLVTNLVANAIKFTPDGGRVEAHAGDEAGAIVLEVADTGIGIPANEQDQLFERFFRASSATAAQVPGTGLGLAISKAIAEAHGGTIGFKSREGGGTTFRVELPREASA